MACFPRSLTLAFVLLVQPEPSYALDIDATKTNFTEAEEAVIDAAIAWWEAIITDDFTFQVDITKVAIPGSTRGETFNFNDDENGRPTDADINIDVDSNGTPWFVDTTPYKDEEFNPGDNPWHFVAKAGGDADGTGDLLSVVIHELAHALGFTINYDNFDDNVTDPGGGSNRTYNGDAGLTATLVPLASGTHLDSTAHPSDLLNTSVGNSQRRLQSYLDRLLLADAFGYIVDLFGINRMPMFGVLGRVLLVMLLAFASVRVLGGRGGRGSRFAAGAAACLAVAFLWIGDARSQLQHELPAVPDADSTVLMTELAVFSDVSVKTVRMYARDGDAYWGEAVRFRSTSSAAAPAPSVSEGVAARSRAAAYAQLWSRLDALDIWSLQDASPDIGIEDASTFVFTVSAGGRSHSFTAHAINHLADLRYLQVYQEIKSCLTALAEGG